MSKQVKTVSMLLALSALSVGTVNAGTITSPNAVQNVQTDAECKGVVIDATGEPMIGASVVVKGKTGLGTVTDIDGNFTLKNVNKGEIIRITSLGMNPVEVAWEGKALKVTMKDDSKQINEVVVTALGIKRERKSLGYAIQDVKGDAILNSHENNVANALTGKIAGVQITRSSNGPGGSSKIQLRGNNSVTGLNQPLIVVDGAQWTTSPDRRTQTSGIRLPTWVTVSPTSTPKTSSRCQYSREPRLPHSTVRVQVTV